MLRVDKDALRRALATVRDQSPGRREQIDAKLAEEPWLEVAAFAASICQSRALKLKPWQTPPCGADPDRVDDRQALELAERLEAAGLSVYEPDPVAALAALEARVPGGLPPAA